MAKVLKQEKGAAEYAGEAVKHWAKAAGYGASALAAKRRAKKAGEGGFVERLKSAGGISDLADNALQRLGASPHPGLGNGGATADDKPLAAVELPIQESIDVAIPVAAVFDLCLAFEEFPEFLDRVESVEREGERALLVAAKVGGHVRELELEVMDERPGERLDWLCGEGYEHSGVISLHPLAPRLTRLELTVERQPETTTERLARRLGLPQRTIQEELRRFKAYAELWEESDEYDDADLQAPEEEDEEEPVEPEEEDQEEPVDADEEEVDEEPAEPAETTN